ncbi:CSC1-like protein At3g54510 isoform X2 [Musa acuminata AAA Group]|uniref:CSC1-like protein At3g54510 isoform X2 n=1 Tax=Musa acuminata AAA Group TaxID=214697 RepID=UPI0031E027E3
MNAASLLASAGMNIGLALVVLSLFSVLKKQPCSAPVYFARRIARREALPLYPAFSLARLRPTASWISRAFRVTEDEVLRIQGLDALVVLRFFKFGTKLFTVCSIIGLLILVPVNFTCQDGHSRSEFSYSMDAFTISNIGKGCNRLWIHFACLCFISFYILYLLYMKLAYSLQHKIKDLHRKAVEKPMKWLCLCDTFWSHIGDPKIHEESLQEVRQRIHLLQHENIINKKELPVAFVSFKSRCGAAFAAQTQQHMHPLLWTTEAAPEPRDVIWKNLAIPCHLLALYRTGIFIAALLLTVFFALPVTAVQGIAQFENLKKWFPPARAVQIIPGLSSFLTGYLPSVILNSFIYVIPYAMVYMASLEGYISQSRKEMRACSMVFYFLVGNVFFLSLLSGSLLQQIGESFTHPKDFPSHLASAVSAQSDFFITYILTDGLSGFSLEILQLGLVTWHVVRTCLFGQSIENDSYLFGFPYYRVIPIVSLAILIGMVYAVISPLLLPFLIIYFLLGYAVYVNQMQDVYDITYDTCGQYWPHIHHYLFITIILMQITMIGIFGLKSKPGASVSTILLLLMTILFNEYCKIRFVPTFCHCPIKVAKENDDCDEGEGELQANQEIAIDAYHPPWMRPVSFAGDAAYMKPLGGEWSRCRMKWVRRAHRRSYSSGMQTRRLHRNPPLITVR